MCPPLIGEAIQFDSIYFLLERLEFDLNNTDAFDFEYDPNEGDLIEFYFHELSGEVVGEKGLEATFLYKNGEFIREEMGLYRGGKRLASGDLRYVPNPGTNPDSSTSTPRMPGFLKDFSSK